jgi:hypothetical protein
MNTDEWKAFILEWSERIAQQDLDNYYGEERNFDPVHGYGTTGAIAATESRLGIALPPSYKEFLKASNGLKQPLEQLVTTGGDFWPAEEIDWFRVRNKEWIDAWIDGENSYYRGEPAPETPDEQYFVYGSEQNPCDLRSRYMQNALEISHDGDAGIYLLISDVINEDGEWEAWHLASWLPGAGRFRSFEEMMKEHYTALVQDTKSDRCHSF